jgi:hypothetical protein
MRVPLLLTGRPALTSAPSRPSAPLARVRQGLTATLERAGSAFQRRPADPEALAAQNRKLGQQLADADPRDVGKIFARELTSFGANYGLSALDNTEIGKAIAAVLRVKPSTAATLVTAAIAFLAPRRWRRARAAAAKVGKGGAHAVLARLGQATPEALASRTHTSGVEGVEPETEAAPDEPEREPDREPEQHV